MSLETTGQLWACSEKLKGWTGQRQAGSGLHALRDTRKYDSGEMNGLCVGSDEARRLEEPGPMKDPL